MAEDTQMDAPFFHVVTLPEQDGSQDAVLVSSSYSDERLSALSRLCSSNALFSEVPGERVL